MCGVVYKRSLGAWAFILNTALTSTVNCMINDDGFLHPVLLITVFQVYSGSNSLVMDSVFLFGSNQFIRNVFYMASVRYLYAKLKCLAVSTAMQIRTDDLM